MFKYSTRVLYYHVIADDLPAIYCQGITPRSFERQLALLWRLGWNFVSLSDAVRGTAGLPPKRVCLTLDDGFACNFDPLLKAIRKYGVKPTLFLVGKCLDNRALAWNHKLQLINYHVPPSVLDDQVRQLTGEVGFAGLFRWLKMQDKDTLCDSLWDATMPFTQAEYLSQRKPFFSLSELKTLVAQGAELALHSHSHPDFSRLTPEEAIGELEANQAALEEARLPYRKLFAYPYGRVATPQTEETLREQCQLEACLGTRFVSGDNLNPQARWQRQNLEHAVGRNYLEFFLYPHARKLKDRLLR